MSTPMIMGKPEVSEMIREALQNPNRYNNGILKLNEFSNNIKNKKKIKSSPETTSKVPFHQPRTSLVMHPSKPEPGNLFLRSRVASDHQ